MCFKFLINSNTCIKQASFLESLKTEGETKLSCSSSGIFRTGYNSADDINRNCNHKRLSDHLNKSDMVFLDVEPYEIVSLLNNFNILNCDYLIYLSSPKPTKADNREFLTTYNITVTIKIKDGKLPPLECNDLMLFCDKLLKMKDEKGTPYFTNYPVFM